MRPWLDSLRMLRILEKGRIHENKERQRQREGGGRERVMSLTITLDITDGPIPQNFTSMEIQYLCPHFEFTSLVNCIFKKPKSRTISVVSFITNLWYKKLIDEIEQLCFKIFRTLRGSLMIAEFGR